MHRVAKSGLTILITTAVGGVGGILVGWESADPVSRHLSIKARQYAFEPSVLRINRGDTLYIKLASSDVVHGFFLEGYDLDAEIHANQTSFRIRHPSLDDGWSDVEEFSLVASRRGKFRYRCSHTCGSMHPFMQGELVVQPNSPYHAGFGGFLGLFAGMMWTFVWGTRRTGSPTIPDSDEE